MSPSALPLAAVALIVALAFGATSRLALRPQPAAPVPSHDLVLSLILPTAPARRTATGQDAPYTTLACVILLAVLIWSYSAILCRPGGVRRHSAQSTVGLPEAKVEVRNAPGKGMGAFALEHIEVGSWVCRYVGKLIDWDEYVRLSQTDASLLDYIFKIVDPVTDAGEGAVFLDARESRHFSRYFNHAEEGNLEFEVYPEERRVEFFACRDIAAGEELTFDYGENYWTGERPVDGSDSRARWTRGELDDGSGPFWHDEAGEIILDDPYRPSASYAAMERLGRGRGVPS